MNVAICLPTGDEVKADFALSLAALVACSAQRGLTVDLRNHRRSNLPKSREILAKQALAGNPTHLLWIDSDMLFPPWALLSLLSHKKAIVSANYCKRDGTGTPVAHDKFINKTGQPVYPRGQGLTRVEAVGMGLTLIEAGVFRAIAHPWFPITWSDERQQYDGEDFAFCKKARDAGFEIWIDETVTRYMGHTGTSIYSFWPDDPETLRNRAWTADPGITTG